MTTTINGSSPSITFSDGTTQSTAANITAPYTSSGVVYASSTTALATGSALTFDGNKLTSNALTFGYNTSYYNTDNSISNYSSGNYLYVSGNGTTTGGLYLQGGGNQKQSILLDGISTGGNIAFQTNGSERMRLDSSGNLLVGTTTALSGSNHIVVGSNAIQGIRKDFTNLGTSAQSFGFSAVAGSVYVASMKSVNGASVVFLISVIYDNAAILMYTTSLGGCTAGGTAQTITSINADSRVYTFYRDGGDGLLYVYASSTATGTTTIYLTPLGKFA